MIKIVGLGPGNPELMTLAAVNAIAGAEIIAGAERNIESSFELLKSVDLGGNIENLKIIKLEKDLTKFIKSVEEHYDENTVVVVSGDPGFYSLLDTFNKAGTKVTAVPGISSYQYFYSRLGMSYKNHRLLSCHGRTMDYVKALEESDGIFLLTDGETTPKEICKSLVTKGLGNATVHVGENLSYENEEIISGKAEDFIDREFSILSSVIIEKG